ncbi:unnamed protein product, partial [Candidula unifasciata]
MVSIIFLLALMAEVIASPTRDSADVRGEDGGSPEVGRIGLFNPDQGGGVLTKNPGTDGCCSRRIRSFFGKLKQKLVSAARKL